MSQKKRSTKNNELISFCFIIKRAYCPLIKEIKDIGEKAIWKEVFLTYTKFLLILWSNYHPFFSFISPPIEIFIVTL